MQQIGTVVNVQDGCATIRFARTKACEHCGACIRFGDDEAQVELDNVLDAEAGDIVKVELHAKSFLQASLLVYILPLSLLLGGVALGSIWSEVWGIMLGLLGAGSVYVLLRALEPRFARSGAFNPHMITIMPKDYFSGGEKDE